MLDCLVIGAGPAGLTAAIYLARFHLTLAVIDAGESRAALIPRTRNHAGYPDGIAGNALLELMRKQAGEYGVQVRRGRVDHLTQDPEGFRAHIGDAEVAARTVLLATGIVNNRPDMTENDHSVALARGLIRYCPICDGFEVTDKRVAVIGQGTHGFEEAVFLRMYTADLALLAPGESLDLTDAQRLHLEELGVVMRDGPCARLEVGDAEIAVPLPHETLTFDSVYPALGSRIRSDLAVGLGAGRQRWGAS